MRISVYSPALFILLVLLTSCSSTDGPTFKDKVDQALNLYYQGEELERSEDFETAAEKYLASIKITPRPRAYFRLAYVLWKMDRFAEADTYIDKALELSPNYRLALQLKKQIQVGQKELSQSQGSEERPKAMIPQAMEKEPVQSIVPETPPPAEKVEQKTSAQPSQGMREGKTPNSLIQQARDAEKQKNWGKAAAVYQSLLMEEQENPVYYYNYGYALFRLENYNEAVDAFRKAVELQPDFADAYNDMGVALEQLNRSAEAKKSYEQAIKQGQAGDAYFNLAMLNEKLGQYKQAIDLYEKFMEIEENSAFSQYAQKRIEILRRKAY